MALSGKGGLAGVLGWLAESPDLVSAEAWVLSLRLLTLAAGGRVEEAGADGAKPTSTSVAELIVDSPHFPPILQRFVFEQGEGSAPFPTSSTVRKVGL